MKNGSHEEAVMGNKDMEDFPGFQESGFLDSKSLIFAFLTLLHLQRVLDQIQLLLK